MTLREQLERTAAAARRTQGAVRAGGAVVVAVLTLTLGALVLADGRWLRWSVGVPFALWGLALLLGWAFWRRRVGGSGRTTALDVAAIIERERGVRWGAVTGLAQLGAQGGALVQRQIAQMESTLGDGPWAPRYAAALTRSVQRTGAAVLAVAVVVLLTGWRAPDGWRAVLHPVAAAQGQLLNPISLQRTPREGVRGTAFTATVTAPGRRQVTVAWRATGAAWRDSTVPITDGEATIAVGVLDAPLLLVATDGRAVSDTLQVALRERPYAGDVQLRAVYPAYLARADDVLIVDGVLRVPEGTALQWTTRVAGLGTLALVTETDTATGAIEASRATGRLIARASATWRWQSAPADADVPPALSIDVLSDPAPQVRIVAPAGDTTIVADAMVPVSVDAIDDLRVESVQVRVWRERADGVRSAPTVLPLRGTPDVVWSGGLQLDIAALGAVDGETVVAVAEARDGAPFGRVGTSTPLRLRLPSARERRDAAIASADSAVRAALAAASAQRALGRRTDDAARMRSAAPAASATGAAPPAASFDAQERARTLAGEQRALGERVQSLSERASDLARQLTEAGITDSSVQSQLREAQRLLQEAMTPALQQQLRELEARRQQGSDAEVQDALRNLQPQQDQVREALERSTELMKRAALEGTLQAMGAEAQEVATEQRAFADSAASGARPGAARELAARAEAVQRAAREVAERMRADGSPEARSSVERAAAEAAESRRAMDEAARSAEQQARAEAQRAEALRASKDSAARTEAGQRGVDSSGRRAAGQQQAQQQGQQQQGQRQTGQQQQGQQQQGQQQQGQQQGQQQTGQQQQAGGQRQAAAAPPGGQQLPGGMTAPQGAPSNDPAGAAAQSSRDAAQRAAEAMDRAAGAFGSARAEQIAAWKQDLTGALDQSIQETMQMARQQDALSQAARRGADPGDLRGEQGALQQGVQQTAERVSQQGRQSALVSPRTQQAMAEARERVAQAGQQMRGGSSGSETAEAMSEAADALRRAAASMARDRERAANAESASGLPELLQQMQEMAQQQGALNGEAASLMASAGATGGEAARSEALRQLAERQRELARGLQDASDQDRSGRSDQMVRDAEQVAQALGRGQLDPSVLERQQQLFRRMLDAGRALEKDERDPTGERESRAGGGLTGTAPASGTTRGAAAQRYREPTYDELRGLSAEERRVVLDYFRRLNGGR